MEAQVEIKSDAPGYEWQAVVYTNQDGTVGLSLSVGNDMKVGQRGRYVNLDPSEARALARALHVIAAE